jgi:hypothetical protein
MSLRPEICGFDLAKFRSWFGSGDSKVIAAIESDFAQFATANQNAIDAGYRATFHAALRQAINEGVPFPDLQDETGPHVHLAILLAAHEQELVGTDSNHWKLSGFSEVWESGEIFIAADEHADDAAFWRDLGFSEFEEPRSSTPSSSTPIGADSLFQHILYGRPIFGAQFDTSWSYYGYLSRDEIQILRSQLQIPDDDELAAELVAGLMRWCDELTAAHKDMWVYWT